jgi:DNA polymerase III subunit gamma/tau
MQAFEIAGMIINQDSTGAIQKINNLLNDGYDLEVFNKSLVNYLRQLMLLKISPELKSSFAYEITSEQIEKMIEQTKKTDLQKIIIAINLFMDAQRKISSFMLTQLPLEIAIIKATHAFPAIAKPISYTTQSETNEAMRNKNNLNPKSQIINLAYRQAGPKQISSAVADNNQNSKESIKQEKIDQSDNKPESKDMKQILTYDVQSNWNKLLDAIKPHNHSLQALLFGCQVVSSENNTITLATPYDFYKQKLNDPVNRLTVEDVFGKILGSKIKIKTVTNKEAGIKTEIKKEERPGEQNSLLADAINILGGKVVEE